MDLPLPLDDEDELASGHLGRIRQWIRARSRAEVARVLRERLGAPDHDSMPLLHVVAAACGLQPDHYVGRCSMLPFTCFLVNESWVLGRAAPRWSKPVVGSVGLLTPARLPVFCPNCAAEQRRRSAFSIWHRALQLPGQRNCVQHDCHLLQAPSVESFMEQPSDVLASGGYVQVPDRQWATDQPAVSRFLKSGQAMLSTGRSWSTSSVRAVLSRQASLRGLRTSRGRSLPLLSDLAFDVFPVPFMEEHFSLYKLKRQGVAVSTIDCSVMKAGNTPTGTAVALAISLLYESPIEAIVAFAAESELAQPR